MRFHRFYISEKVGDKNEIEIHSFDLINQIKKVFRLGIGDKVFLFDGSGNDYECKINSFENDDGIRLSVIDSKPSRYIPKRKVFILQAIIKKDKFEWVVEKATELGVTDIVPIISDRSEKKALNLERLKKIAIEASEQCGRGDIPEIHCARRGLEQVIHNDYPQMIAFSCGKTVGGLASDIGVRGDISVFIGPEGGWTEKELEMFHGRNIPIHSLGSQIFRAETAAIVALARLF